MKGRSKAYVDAVCAALPDVRVSTHVSSVKRVPGGVTITTKNGAVVEEYEDVIFACHSDQVLSLLGSGRESLFVVYRPCMPFNSSSLHSHQFGA